MLRIEHWIGKKLISVQVLPRCEWCGSDFLGHERDCPDLED